MKIFNLTVLTCALLAASAANPALAQTSTVEPAAPEQWSNTMIAQDQPGVMGSEDGKGFVVAHPRRPVNGDRPLLVHFQQSDSKEATKLEDDLAVMSHLLQKAIAEKVGAVQGQRNVLGVDVSFAPGSQPIRTIYLEGYGALFLLQVGFPLHPPLKAESAPKEKETTDSMWEEARREYYGMPAGNGTTTWVAQPYDQGKVDALKETLFQALKSASNIRGLNSSDVISVCVAGSASVRSLTSETFGISNYSPNKFGANNPMQYYTSADTLVQRSFLNIRVKKSDVDALAAGRVTPEEFAKAAAVVAYLGTANPGSDSGSAGL